MPEDHSKLLQNSVMVHKMLLGRHGEIWIAFFQHVFVFDRDQLFISSLNLCVLQ